MTIGKVHLTKKYARFRIENPRKFRSGSFRTQTLSEKKGVKRIAGRLKTNNKWKTQSILIARKNYNKGIRVKGIVKL